VLDDDDGVLPPTAVAWHAEALARAKSGCRFFIWPVWPVSGPHVTLVDKEPCRPATRVVLRQTHARGWHRGPNRGDRGTQA
jgi:hypothetical protein